MLLVIPGRRSRARRCSCVASFPVPSGSTAGRSGPPRFSGETLADKLGTYGEETRERTEDQGEGNESGGGMGVDFVVRADAEARRRAESTSGRRQAFTRRRPADQLALLNALERNRDVVLFIDDFHYVAQDVQLAIVRGLKAPIFDGTRVIVASVPHRAYDSVRVEKEMTGRVEPLFIPIWEHTV